MLNKIIYLPLILLLVIPMIFSYTPPNINSINITMCADYTPPNINSINITLDTENDCLIDSCTYSFGNWIINCEDNCTITTNVNGDGSNFSANGVGFFSIQANISGFRLYHFGKGCNARCLGGNCIKI